MRLPVKAAKCALQLKAANAEARTQ